MRKRTGWIWAISILYVISAIWTLLSFYLTYSGRIALTTAQRAYYQSFSFPDITLTLLVALANFSGALMLFLLRRVAFPLLSGGLAASVIIYAWHIASKGFLQAIEAPGIIGALLALGISTSICIYTWRLVKRGVLT